MVRQVGVTLYGPPPHTLIPEISQSEFVETAREHAEWWIGRVYEMRTPGAQSYAVLTMCRALYTNTHGTQASKKQAALWAKACMPQWAPLIQQSLDWLSGQGEGETDDEAGLQETVRFVHDIADRINSTVEGAPNAPG